MTALADRELLRARWRRHLAVQELDTADRTDFSLGGLGRRVREPTARFLLLPSDPDREIITIDSEFWDRLNELKTVNLGECCRVRLGNQQVPTAHAAALVNSYGRDEPWNNEQPGKFGRLPGADEPDELHAAVNKSRHGRQRSIIDRVVCVAEAPPRQR